MPVAPFIPQMQQGAQNATKSLTGFGGSGMANKLGAQLQQKGMMPGADGGGLSPQVEPGMSKGVDLSGDQSMAGDKSMGGDSGFASPGAAQGMGHAIGQLMGGLTRGKSFASGRGFRGGRR
jgi:hypothetical protein